MAYMTPEERISEAVGRGWRRLASRFDELRPVDPLAGAVLPPAVMPVQSGTPQLAKVPMDVSTLMPRQALAPQHLAGTAGRVMSGISSGGSYDTGRAFATDGSNITLAGPNGMRQNMSVADFRTSMNPNTAPSQSSNLDVSFDPSVSQGARRAFAADPIAPTVEMVSAPRGQFYGARPIPGRDTPAAPATIGEAVVDGIRQRRSQFQAGQDLALRGQDIQAEEAGMRNQLLAERNASLAPLEAAQGQAAQMEVNNALRAQKMFDDYNVEVDPDKKAALLRQYKLLTGVKDDPGKTYSGTEESMTPEGIRQTAYVLEKGPDGSWVKRVPQEGAGGGDLKATFAALTPEVRAKVEKNFEKRSDVTPAEVLAYIQTINK